MDVTAVPQLRLNRDAVDNNIAVMSEWCKHRGVQLAPHVKTTMSSEIIARQMAAGAVGVTVATVDQVDTVLGWGHRNVLVANQVVDPSGLARLRGWLHPIPGQDEPLESTVPVIRILVDSPAGVDAAARVFTDGSPALPVLLDVGTMGGRTGIRTVEEAFSLAEMVAAAPGLLLAGVSGFEGVVPSRRDNDVVAAVDSHCALVRDVFQALGDYYDTPRPIFTMGGSAFPDRVIAHLPQEVAGTVVVLRSGCYVTHDHGVYEGVSPIDGLVAALSVRAAVISTPEPGMVVVGAGKRDLAYDLGLPSILGLDATVRSLYDHHAVVETGAVLSVGDIVEFGFSHPCSVFDRWPAYVSTLADGSNPELWRTEFGRSSVG